MPNLIDALESGGGHDVVAVGRATAVLPGRGAAAAQFGAAAAAID